MPLRSLAEQLLDDVTKEIVGVSDVRKCRQTNVRVPRHGGCE